MQSNLILEGENYPKVECWMLIDIRVFLSFIRLYICFFFALQNGGQSSETVWEYSFVSSFLALEAGVV